MRLAGVQSHFEDLFYIPPESSQMYYVNKVSGWKGFTLVLDRDVIDFGRKPAVGDLAHTSSFYQITRSEFNDARLYQDKTNGYCVYGLVDEQKLRSYYKDGKMEQEDYDGLMREIFSYIGKGDNNRHGTTEKCWEEEQQTVCCGVLGDPLIVRHPKRGHAVKKFGGRHGVWRNGLCCLYVFGFFPCIWVFFKR